MYVVTKDEIGVIIRATLSNSLVQDIKYAGPGVQISIDR